MQGLRQGSCRGSGKELAEAEVRAWHLCAGCMLVAAARSLNERVLAQPKTQLQVLSCTSIHEDRVSKRLTVSRPCLVMWSSWTSVQFERSALAFMGLTANPSNDPGRMCCSYKCEGNSYVKLNIDFQF